MATVSLKQSENVLSPHKVVYPCSKYAPASSTIFAGMENSFSVSLCKRLVGNIWIIPPDGPEGRWFRAMGLHWSACSGSPQPLLLDKEKSFLITLRSIQRVKQRMWSDLRKAWRKITGRAKWVFHYFMWKVPERNAFLFAINFINLVQNG